MVVVGCQPLAGESMRWIKDTVTGLANPHDAAARNKVGKLAKYLSQGGDVNKRNKLGDTPLHEACAYIRDNGDSSKSKGKRRKQVTKDRRKVGKKLSRRQLGDGGALEMLEMLINAGCDINAQNIVGDAPLHKAALNGRTRSADFLIKAGANVNIRNEFAQTPLHAACVSGNIEVVQRLVQGGADTSAQDAAEDTPFHEACRHQYEGIVIYLMGLVNNPETSQGLKLWQGLDPSWEKILRDRAQAQVEGAEDRGEKPATVSTATEAGLSSVRLGISTPSTTHNSLRSSESAMGLGLANRTPVRQGQCATAGGVKVSVKGSGQKMVSASPSASRARGGGGSGAGGRDARKRSAKGGAAGAGGAGASSDGADLNSTGGSRPGSRPGSAARRRHRDGGGERERAIGHTRTFSAEAAEVLAWQATKAKSAQQERLIDKAREALREEQNEAAMAMSSTTLGDDDTSVDTINTADTPTTIGSRGSRPRSQGVSSGVSPAAAAAAAGAGGEGCVYSGSRRVKTQSRDMAAAAAEGAPPGDGKGKVVSPVMPTPPRSEVNVDTLVPPREIGRRQSARKSRSQVVMLKSPPARVARRSSGSGGFSKSDTVDGRGSSRRSSHRSGAPRTSSDHRPNAGGRDRDAERSSHRSSGDHSSRTSAEHEGHGLGSSSSAIMADSGQSSRSRSSRSREGEGAPPRENDDGGAGGRAEGRTPSSRRERHRHREGWDGEASGRPCPRSSGSGTGRRGHRSSRGQEEGHPSAGGGGGSSSSRRRESKRQSRSSREGAAVANGDAAGAASTPVAALAQTTTPVASAAGATEAAASGNREVPSSVLKAIKVSHDTPLRTRDGRPTPSKSREGRATPLKMSEARERKTPSAPSSGSRPSAKAPKQRSGGQELRPPTWASTVSPGVEQAASRKKVIASDLPVRRVSPYSNTRKQGSLGTGGGPAPAALASKHFFPSPSRSAASRPVAKTIDLREDNVKDSSCGGSFDPATKDRGKADVSGVRAAASRPVAKTIDLRGDTDNDSCCGSSFDPAGRDDVGSDGRLAEAAGKITSPQKSPPRTSMPGGDEDCPPLIDALMMGKGGAAANGDCYSSQRSKKRLNDEDKKNDTSEERVSPAPSRPYKITDIALAKSKSLLFSDSDSDSDRSSSGEASQRRDAAASTFGRAESIAALSAVSKVFRLGRDADHVADGAAPFEVFTPTRKADAAGASATAASTAPTPPPPPPPPPASSSSATVSAQAAPPAEAPARSVPPEGVDGTGPAAVDGPEVTGAAAAQAVHGNKPIVEPSAAPRVLGQAVSSTSNPHVSTKAGLGRPAAGLSATATAGGLGGTRGRPSALGRPGMAPTKVSMPIVGGRAAWNKFLAGTAPGGESAPDDAEASIADASADGDGQGTDAGACAEGSGGYEESDSSADLVEEQDEVLATRGPRGFKSAADSQEGPNKGPAGAFSGNAMWRLTIGASSAANKVKSGVAANGHGGYSNPLAAMRAGGNGAAARGGADGAMGGGGVANPLAGLRGAASMGGAGTANPLARGRGRGARTGGAGGIANPMLRGGGAGGIANPLARAPTVSGGMLSSGSSGPAAKEPATPSGGVTASAAAAAEVMVGVEGVAPTSTSTSEGATTRASIDEAIGDRPTEFRAIGSNGSWQKGGRIPIPPRRPKRAEPRVEANPGQAKVGGLVMALQNTGDSRSGPMLKDLESEDSASTSSLSVLDSKGLVSLHRAKYSPHPTGPGMAGSRGFDA
eukprot:g8013.t1